MLENDFEQFERTETQSRQVVLFSDLREGDTILLETIAGKAYGLTISSTKDDEILASIDNQVSGEKSTRWGKIAAGSVIEVQGSVKESLSDMGEHSPSPKNKLENRFAIGEYACLRAMIDDVSNKRITDPVKAIQVIKPPEVEPSLEL